MAQDSIRLDKEKKKILFDILENIKDRELKTGTDFAYMIETTILENVKNQGRIKDSQFYLKNLETTGAKIINNFLNNYICDEENKYNFTGLDAAIKQVISYIVDAMIETYGSAIYVNYGKNDETSTKFQSIISNELTERGFKKILNRSGLFVDFNRKDEFEIKEENQEFLIKQFLLCKENFIDNFASNLPFKPTKEVFDKYMRAIEFMFNNLEMRMTDKTRNLPEIVKVKEGLDKLLNETSVYYAGRNVKGARYSDLYEKVNEATLKTNKSMTEQNKKEIIYEFLKRCEVLHKAISYVSEDGKNYPANFFIVMPISPYAFQTLATQVQKNSNLTKEQYDFLTSVKGEVKFLFPSQDSLSNGKYHDFDEFVEKKFKGLKVQNKDRDIDLGDADVFNQFRDKIRGYMETYNLPQLRICVNVIANDVMKGREPFNFGFETEKENKSVKEKVK